MQIGIIGTGHMGGMLARGFARTGPETVYIFNRSHAKAEAVANGMNNIVVSNDFSSVIEQAEVIFLCTKACDGLQIIEQIGRELTADQLLVTTISSIRLDEWREWTKAYPVKLIPSLTQTVLRGVLLLSYPSDVPAGNKMELRTKLEERLSQIGKPFVIEESQVRVSSDLSSCGPAFLANVCQAWARAACLTGNIDLVTAESLVREMLIGLSALVENGMSFEEVIRQIRIPGGVTERGILSMEDAPQRLFARVHAETAKFSHMVPHSAAEKFPDPTT